MAGEVKGRPLAFAEDIDYHANKLALPSKAWTDIFGREHGRGFIVAGAATDELVTGFYEAIGKDLGEGRTLADFRKDFDRLVSEHGWSYNGSRGWRSAVIYDTNLSQAYNAGRWEQAKGLDDPIGRYRHNPSAHERKEHKAWHGTTLPLSHGFWSAHWPINAWGCHCQVDVLSRKAAQVAGWTVSDDPPPDPMVERKVNTSSGPMTVTVPKGIDPGFDYNPGEAAFGHRLNEQVMGQWRQAKRDAWEVLTPGDRQTAGRPEMVPVDKPKAALGQKAANADDLTRAITDIIGGTERVFALPDGSRVLVDAAALAGHVDPRRAAWLPFLPDLLNDPYEVWMAFERHKGTGRVELRKRIIKVIDLPDRGALTLVAQVNKGRLEAWTLVPSDKPKQLDRSRVGKLLYGRK